MDEYYRAVQALPAWLARPLSALPPDIAEQVHEIRLRVGCGVQLTIGGKPCCPAGLPALQKLRLTPLQMEEIFVTLCNGSVHSHETEIAAGYVTLRCGCRAGLAGQFYCAPGQSAVLQELRSVNIRVARNREFPLSQKLRDILQQRFIGMLLMGNPTAAKRPFCGVSPGNLAKQEQGRGRHRRAEGDIPLGGNSGASARHPQRHAEGAGSADGSAHPLAAGDLVGRAGRDGRALCAGTGAFSGVEFIATFHAASWEEAARRPQVQYLQKCGALHVAVLLKGRTAPGQLKEVRFRENASSRLGTVLAGLRLVRRGCGLPEYAAASGGAGKDALLLQRVRQEINYRHTDLTLLFRRLEQEGACHGRKLSGPLSAARSDAPGTRLFHRVLLGPWPDGGRAGVPAAGILSGAFHGVLQQAQERARPQLELSHKLGVCCRTGGGHPLPLMKGGECVWTST